MTSPGPCTRSAQQMHESLQVQHYTFLEMGPVLLCMCTGSRTMHPDLCWGLWDLCWGLWVLLNNTTNNHNIKLSFHGSHTHISKVKTCLRLKPGIQGEGKTNGHVHWQKPGASLWQTVLSTSGRRCPFFSEGVIFVFLLKITLTIYASSAGDSPLVQRRGFHQWGGWPLCFQSLVVHSFWNMQVSGCFPHNSAENISATNLCDRTMGDKLPCHFNQSHPHLSSDLSRVKPFIMRQLRLLRVAVFLNLLS